MATYGNYALRLPASLMDDLRIAAESDGVSMNGFIVQAVAEKIAALRARGLLADLSPEEQAGYLADRASRGREGRMADILNLAGTTDVVQPEDEIPEGWLDQRPGGEATPRL